METVAGVCAELVDVDGHRPTHVHVDAVGGRVAEDDHAVVATAVAPEVECTAHEVDVARGGEGGARGTERHGYAVEHGAAAQGERVIHG